MKRKHEPVQNIYLVFMIIQKGLKVNLAKSKERRDKNELRNDIKITYKTTGSYVKKNRKQCEEFETKEGLYQRVLNPFLSIMIMDDVRKDSKEKSTRFIQNTEI